MNQRDTAPTVSGRFLKVSDAARHVFGTDEAWAISRVRRMVDRGELRAVRIGERGDRLIPAEAIEELASTAT